MSAGVTLPADPATIIIAKHDISISSHHGVGRADAPLSMERVDYRSEAALRTLDAGSSSCFGLVRVYGREHRASHGQEADLSFSTSGT